MLGAKLLSSMFLAALVSSTNALSSSLTQITANFGANPTGVKVYLYKPTKVATPTPLILALHYCTGTAEAYFSGTTLAQLADTHGFMVIYGTAPAVGGCWDVSTDATLTHDGGGDSLALANVARYAISSLGADASRVFVTGTSSGAMMTNVLLGSYPDIFKAGALFSGVPYGCFKGPYAWNSQCSQGELIQTPQQWGDLVRSGYPGYTGPRPPVQFWHGTNDTALYPQNFWEEIKQWTNVFNVSQTPTSNVTNNPESGYSRASFGPNIQAILAQGVGHTVPEHEDDVLAWFGLSNLTPGSGSATTTTTTPVTSTSAPATTSTAPAGTVAHWAQCGGQGWTGPTVCVAPYVCTASSIWWSQCL